LFRENVNLSNFFIFHLIFLFADLENMVVFGGEREDIEIGS
jgi:hypothetical protein